MLPGITGLGGRAYGGVAFKVTAVETHASGSGWNGSDYTFTVEVPPHSAGDLLLVFACLTGITSGNISRIQASPPPSGWTLVEEHEGVDTFSQASQLVLFRKIADGNNSAITTFEVVVTGYLGNRFGSVGVAITGVETTTPLEASTGKSVTSSTDPAAPSLILTAGKRLVLTCLACDDDNALGIGTYPGDMVGTFLRSSSSPNHFGLFLGYEVGTFEDGSYGPGNWDMSFTSGELGIQITYAARA